MGPGMFALLLLMLGGAMADYDCICNYNSDLNVYSAPDSQSALVGHMYEFDCKPKSSLVSSQGYFAIQFEKQGGYIQINDNVKEQICSGQASPDDLVPTTVTRGTSTTVKPSMTSSKQYSTTTRSPIPYTTTRKTTANPTTVRTTRVYSTTIKMTTQPVTTTMRRSTSKTTVKPTTTPKTTVKRTTPSSTISSEKVTTAMISSTNSRSSIRTTTQRTDTSTTSIIKDHLEACPDHVKSDVNLKGGFLGQYGEFCFEVVDWLRPFDAAESHCKITSGHLVAITNQEEQNYVTNLLAKHQYTKSSWIGLNDKAGEGVFSWTSGAPFSYKNFQGDYNQHSPKDHKLNDCFLIKEGGEWTDVPCGLSISFLGIGEQHPFICQYNISAKLQSLFEIIPEFIG